VIHPVRLRTEYLADPLGIDVTSPRLSWWLEADDGEQAQSAYEVEVSSPGSGSPDLWASGVVSSARQAHVEYNGRPLESRQTCNWRVRVRDERGKPSAWSDLARWEMGLLTPSDWQARWVRHVRATAGRPSLFRRPFTARGDLVRARLYATAHGIYVAHINGTPVSDAALRPGWTDYPTRTQYQVYDVTALVAEGENVLTAVLAGGWYSGHVAMVGKELYGKRPALLAQLEVTYADGTRLVARSGSGMRASHGPWLAGDLLMGEAFDGRLADCAWMRPGFDDSDWAKARVVAGPPAPLIAECSEPVRPIQQVGAISAAASTTADATVFDMGANIVGRVRLRVSGPAATELTVRHAEMLDTEGALYTENLRTARATDTYILAGNPEGESFEPTFTFHGFRFVEVRGLGSSLPKEACTGIVLSSGYPVAGEFECSDPMVNTLQANIVRSMRGNFVDIPTDCPQRDERAGWMGDAQIFVRTATCNGAVGPFFTKWLRDVVDACGPFGFRDVSPMPLTWNQPGAPGWGDAGVIVPWTLYRVYGDTRLLASTYPEMKRWVDGRVAANPDLLWREQRGNDYGDWLAVGEEASKEVIASAYLARSLDLTSQVATLLNQPDDSRRYRDLADRARTAFRSAYVGANGLREPSQTTCALALRFELLEPSERQAVLDQLLERIAAAGGHLTTGFLGVEHLLWVLDLGGRPDAAHDLLGRRTFPSWGYSIDQGATSIWERWDGWTRDGGFQDPSMNSFNHYSLGAVGAWLFGRLLGIDLDPDVPGFARASVCPRPGGDITWARGWQETIAGRFDVAWRIDGDVFELDLSVPVNATADVQLPFDGAKTRVGGGRHRFESSVDGSR
jgi:alpha-L-rhamnosidase